MEQRTDRRNNYIELLRFLFCMIIFIHHSGHVTGAEVTLLPSGGLAADAFYMLTGYFVMRHIVQRADREIGHPMGYSVRYTLRKLLKTLPYMAFGTVIIYILECVTAVVNQGTLTAVDIISKLRNMVIELTYLPASGIMGTLDPIRYRNAPMWYLSAMLIALPVIMYIAIRYRDVYVNYLIWFVPPMLQGWMVVRFGGVLPWQDFIGPVNAGVIRAVSGMMMGCAIYYAAGALSGSRLKAVYATVIELLLLALFICNVVRGVGGYEELFTLYIIAGALALALSGISYTSRLIWEPLGFLGRISLPIYCIHWGIYRWVAAVFGGLDYAAAIVLTYVLCLVSALVIMYVSKRLKR